MKRLIPILTLSLLLAPTRSGAQAVDPGPRGAPVGAGGPVAGLSADQLRFFQDALARFSVSDTVSTGLGPRFNAEFCAQCHSQPAVGGSSPSTSAFPFVGPNPEVAVATDMGAANTVPTFVTADGPIREARFKYLRPQRGAPGGEARRGFGGDRAVMDPEEPLSPDGSVHDLYTVTGRTDAGGCVLSQPDFARALAEDNVIFRIPTPVFGVGLIESISDETILSSFAASARQRAALGIGGVANRSGNDGTITRFGWKAQNKSMVVFAGEAYNVEVGVTNEVFPNERGDFGVPDPSSCVPLAQPEDSTNFLPVGSDTAAVPSDIVQFALFMRLLDQPAPAVATASGAALFASVGCAACHTPSMTTGASPVAALSSVRANLFSDLMLHHMGSGLADGISQGNAGPDQFRTSPLWGVGQRVFFLSQGQTSDLVEAIKLHRSPGSEANQVIRNFERLSTSDQQDLINFLRSL